MSALHLFYLTLSVVAGLLTPVFAVTLLRGVCIVAKELAEGFRQRAQLANQRGPYTRVQLHEVPNQRMLGVNFYRGDELVYKACGDKP